MNPSELSGLFTKIDTYRDEVVRLQRAMTAIPALAPENGGQGEKDKAEYIKKELIALGLTDIEEINAPDERVSCGHRPNLIARIPGKSNSKTVWIMSHMDIVPPGDLSLWDTDPYEVVEKDGKLYGRGVEDNQQAIVSSLLTVRALHELSIQPDLNFGLAIVADEEVGSGYGIDYVLKNHKSLFGSNDLIIIPDAGAPDGSMIEVAEKSILWIRIEVRGKQTHGSTPEKGVNAHKAGARLIVRMEELYTLFDRTDPLFEPPVSTFEPTKKENNVPNINTIPGEDIFYFDCRILPDYPVEAIQAKIRDWADEIQHHSGVQIDMSYPQLMSAPTPTPADAPVALQLQRAIKDVMDIDAKTMGIGGGTVAAYFRQAGLPAVCWATIDDMAHEPNEYCIIDNVLNDSKVFAHVLMQRATQSE